MRRHQLTVFILSLLTLTLSSGQAVMGDIMKKKPGESVTIHCSPNVTQTKYQPTALALKKVLGNEALILYWYFGAKYHLTINNSLKLRVTSRKTGDFTISTTLSNLTVDDTGVYLCLYSDARCLTCGHTFETRGDGSIFLDVQPAAAAADAKGEHAETNSFNMTLLFVLVGIILLLLCALVVMWIFPKMKMRSMQVHAVGHHQRVKGSDVYEDMRSTVRR